MSLPFVVSRGGRVRRPRLTPRRETGMNTSNLRVTGYQPLVTPRELNAELPIHDARAAVVERSRDEVHRIVTGADDRLLVVVGPCSVHDPVAAVEYARNLAA